MDPLVNHHPNPVHCDVPCIQHRFQQLKAGPCLDAVFGRHLQHALIVGDHLSRGESLFAPSSGPPFGMIQARADLISLASTRGMSSIRLIIDSLRGAR